MRFDYTFIYYIVAILDVAQALVTAHYFDSPSTIDLMLHVARNASGQSLTPIPGSNGHSTAYNLQGTRRELQVTHRMVGKVKELLKTHEEFTLVAAFKQQKSNSGSIISIISQSTRIFEVESSGRRDELRLHYTHRGRLRTETFPYKLADNQWHSVALSFSSVFVEVFIDCTKVYERSISSITGLEHERSMRRMAIWLGQRDAHHAFFKGAIEYISFIAEPNGILEVCPHANIACPTCSQFRQLTHSIKQMYEYIQVLNTKLSAAEDRISKLEECECQKSCTVEGTTYRNQEEWRQDDCTNCTCQNGEVRCATEPCPVANCSNPYKLDGECCKTCGKKCYKKVRGSAMELDDGKSYCESRPSETTGVKWTCENGSMRCDRVTCPEPACNETYQFQDALDCCRKCNNMQFCDPDKKQQHNCHKNAECVEFSTKPGCQCNRGFEGDGIHRCDDVDECLKYGGKMDGNYCGANTRCINNDGSYLCVCHKGFVKVSTLVCEEHDECKNGSHTCHEHADCTNTNGSYICTCKHGYHGDKHTCTAICKSRCQNGGVCESPDVCRCRKGFLGRTCSKDLDECKLGMDQCHNNSVCVNIPGAYLCQCKHGFYSNKADNRHGRLCHDVNECKGWGGGYRCPQGTTCENTEGGYHCRCGNSNRCSGCADHNRWHSNGTSWRSRQNNCTINTCVNGEVQPAPVGKCDCSAENVDVECCPKCKSVGACHFNRRPYLHTQRWVHQCQHCQCLNSEVDCWAMICPRLMCNVTVNIAGDCCMRCAGQQDPCQAASRIRQQQNKESFMAEVNQACPFNTTGQPWTLMAEGCTTCECKEGHICCQYNERGCEARSGQRVGNRNRGNRRRKNRDRTSDGKSRRRRTPRA